MITGVIKNKIDKIWTDIWAGGITVAGHAKRKNVTRKIQKRPFKGNFHVF